MISMIGIGTAGCNIAKLFLEHREYNVFLFSEEQEDTKTTRYLPKLHNPEDCEEFSFDFNTHKTIEEIQERIQVFLCGSSFSANYTLKILEQLKDRKIDIFYIRPDVDLLIGETKLQERAIFGILQQYARSGLFNTMTIISNPLVEKSIGQIPIKKYFETINKSIYYAIHYVNFFEHTDPIVGNLAKPSDVQKIRTIAALSVDELSEKWYYNLEHDRDVTYYLSISTNRLETDGALHTMLVDNLKSKPRNAFKNVTYGIYESPYETDFGFCVAHTNYIQDQKIFDS